jgi:tRNA(Ile)-lysidine synthase
LGGRHKTVGDLFTDAKIPTALRAGWPLIVDRLTETVLWVCGLTVSQAAQITGDTRRVLRLQWLHKTREACAST